MPSLLAPLAVIALLAGCSVTPTTVVLDRAVDALCAKDGGITVHRVVYLPASRFQWQDTIYVPRSSEPLGPDFDLRIDRTYPAVKGNGAVFRTEATVVARQTGEVLGTAVSYSRQGGDIPGPYMPTGYSCPTSVSVIGLVNSIFKKENVK